MAELNFPNRTILTGDNLDVMRQMNEECVDLIYLDPPFNSNRNYAAPIGSGAAGAAFKDTWTLDDVDLAWHADIAEHEPGLYQVIDAAELSHSKGMKAYLIMMSVRLLEMRRILKPTGSLYLHCDPTASHYLKTVLDSIFGRDCYRNEIVWCYTGPSSPKMRNFPRKHDTILRYSRSDKWTWNQQRIPYKDPNQTLRRAMDAGQGLGTDVVQTYRERGKPVEDWWTDIALAVRSPKERTGYPTQKPLALLYRIIKSSSNEGDVVFDPFCGCATALVAAEYLDRQWVGCDISEKALELVNTRLEDQMGIFHEVYHQVLEPRQIVSLIADLKLGDAHMAGAGLTVKPRRYNHPDNKRYLYGYQEGRCTGCEQLIVYAMMEIDHIVPKSEGGSDEIRNLQLLCVPCNRAKGTKVDSEFKNAKIAELEEQLARLRG